MRKKDNMIDTAGIERAERFDATIFLGTGRYWTENLATLAEARQRAEAMAAEVNNGRIGMIYAVTPEGRSIFVPPSYQPKEALIEGDPEMSETNLSGTEIAKLTAMITGGGYKRANSKAAAESRFRKVASEAGIKDKSIDTYLAGPFDMAEHCIREHLAGKPMTIAEVKAASPKAAELDDFVATTKETSEEIKKNPKAARSPKPLGKRAAILAAAEAGELPAAPDFSAKTHERFRPKLAEVVAMAEAGDLAGLEAYKINPVSSSPKAIAKYRDLCVIALKARAAKKDAA